MKINKILLIIFFTFLSILSIKYFYKKNNFYKNDSLKNNSIKKLQENIPTQKIIQKEEQEKKEEKPTDFSIGYKTLKDEIQIPSLTIQGKIPSWLEGTLYRNGPSIFELDNEEIESWYDGIAMLHKFKFENGKISYANKIIQCDDYTNKKSKIRIKNAAVNVCKFNDCFLAFGETPKPVRFNPENLNTECAFEYEDKLPQDKIYESAHPHIDKEKKEIINYFVNYGCLYSSYDVYKIKFGTKKREVIASISVKEPSFMHSFAITKNYVILTEYPFIVNPLNLMFAKVFIEQFQWKPNKGTNFHIINRETGKVKKINFDPFFAFHHINAYEENNSIILDLVAFENPFIIHKTRTVKDRLKKKEYKSSLTGKLSRFKIDLHENKIEKIVLCNKIMEIPRINEDYDGKSYKYIYATGINLKDKYFDEFNQLIKLDVTNCNDIIWQEEHCYPGEPIFVARPKNESEDDGVVLSVVLDSKNEKSFLLILDAKKLKEIARAQLPHHIPFGFHGQFFPKENND